jgi:hypothetical protein
MQPSSANGTGIRDDYRVEWCSVMDTNNAVQHSHTLGRIWKTHISLFYLIGQHDQRDFVSPTPTCRYWQLSETALVSDSLGLHAAECIDYSSQNGLADNSRPTGSQQLTAEHSMAAN